MKVLRGLHNGQLPAGYIRAKFNTELNLREFIEFLREETARKPVEVNDLVVEFTFFLREMKRF